MSDWLIWSNEHRAWWRQGGRGYTVLTQRAGRYTKEGAAEIVEQANKYVPRDPPNEVMVLAPHPEAIRAELMTTGGSDA